MLERISTQIVFLLFDASLKAILLWTLAMLAIRTFRRMSVHEEHRVWTVVLLGLVMLPILAQAGPSWSLPIGLPVISSDQVKNRPSPADSGAGAVNAQITVFPGQSSNARGHDSPGMSSADIRIGYVRNGSLPSGTASIERDGQSPAASPVAGSPPGWFFLRSSLFVLGSMVWLPGVGVMLARLLIAVFRTLRIERAARLVNGQSFPPGSLFARAHRLRAPWSPAGGGLAFCCLAPGGSGPMRNGRPSCCTSSLIFAAAI